MKSFRNQLLGATQSKQAEWLLEVVEVSKKKRELSAGGNSHTSMKESHQMKNVEASFSAEVASIMAASAKPSQLGSRQMGIEWPQGRLAAAKTSLALRRSFVSIESF